MDRRIKDRNILDEICIKFCKVLERHCRYIVVSGFVAISSGRTRGTEDIDVISEGLEKPAFSLLHKDLVKKGFVCMQGSDPEALYEDYLKDSASIRYTYKEHILPEMEFKLAKDALDEYQLRNRVKLPMTGLDVWFSSINANIAFKEELLKSDKDIEDAKHLRIVYSSQVDEKEISNIKRMIKKMRL